MDLVDAVEIVLELARQNALEPNCDPSLLAEATRQQEAIETVEDFATNQLGDD